MRRALVRIDRMKLALRLFRSVGHWLDEVELRQWLADNGLVWVGGSWYSGSGGSNVLHHDEILESAMTETADGITFIDRGPQARPGQTRPPDQSGPA